MERYKNRYLTRLIVKTGKKVVILKISEIDAIESAGNYVALEIGMETFILRQSLNGLQALLSPEKFMRISRSAIVNLDRVKELLPKYNGEQILVLQSGKHLTMTCKLRELEQALRFA